MDLKEKFEEAQEKLDEFYSLFQKIEDLTDPHSGSYNITEYNKKVEEAIFSKTKQPLVEMFKGVRSPLEYAFYLILDILGVEFQTQFFMSIKKFDFYLPQFRLIVELDGKYHDDPIKDNQESREIQKSGYLIFRYRRGEIYYHEDEANPPKLLKKGLQLIATDLLDISGGKNVDDFKSVIQNIHLI